MNSDALIVIYECLDEDRKISFGSEEVEEISKVTGNISTLNLDSFSEAFLFNYLEQSISVVNQILLIVLNENSDSIKGLLPFLNHSMKAKNIQIIGIKPHPTLSKLPNYSKCENLEEIRMNVQSWIKNLSESN
jgi:hypothetical protein